MNAEEQAKFWERAEEWKAGLEKLVVLVDDRVHALERRLNELEIRVRSLQGGGPDGRTDA